MILMSDTGGGHRASAQALQARHMLPPLQSTLHRLHGHRAAFRKAAMHSSDGVIVAQAGFKELFGDRYAIDVVDLATQHSPYPFNQASKSYNTMVSSSAPQCLNISSVTGHAVHGSVPVPPH